MDNESEEDSDYAGPPPEPKRRAAPAVSKQAKSVKAPASNPRKPAAKQKVKPSSFHWVTEQQLNGSQQEHLTSMLKHFALSSRAHFIDQTQRIPIFSDMMGKTRTAAYILMFPGATQEQHAFRNLLPIAQRHHLHFLTNFLVHRLFYHPDFSWEIGFAYNEWTVIHAIDKFADEDLRFRTNAYMCNYSNEDAVSAVRHIFRDTPLFWKKHYKQACTDDFPILALLQLLNDIPLFGPLRASLVVQDLATAGVITNKGLMKAMNEGVVDGKDNFQLLGEGSQGGLAFMLTRENSAGKTTNQQLLDLYEIHKDVLNTRPGEETWDNVTTIEHMACKFFRVVKYCTTNPHRRAEFWRMVGRADLEKLAEREAAA